MTQQAQIAETVHATKDGRSFRVRRARREDAAAALRYIKAFFEEPDLSVTYSPGELLGPSPPGSLEHFFLERYLLFVRRKGRMATGQVYHTPYPAQRVEVASVNDHLVSAAGIQVADELAFAHYSAGVDVEVFPLI